MHPSTARRERLVSPLNLVLMAGLFAIAFFLLKPEADLVSTSSVDAGNVDSLQLAYLKAQNVTGKTSDAEIVRIIHDLVDANRAEQAMELLLDYPALNVDDALRFRIDLELAAKSSDDSLYVALETLVRTPQWHNTSLLERSVLLSRDLQHPKISLALYEAWANTIRLSGVANDVERDIRLSGVYRQCGEHMTAIEQTAAALMCYRSGVQALPDSHSPIDLQLLMLPLLADGGREQQQLLQTLMQYENASVEQLPRVAAAMLALQRPDLAYRLYAHLALRDPSASSGWLSEAARWAQAAGKPADAAVFVDAVAAQANSADRRVLHEEVAQLLVQAGKVSSAFVRVKSQIELRPYDTAQLERGVDIALQAGEPAQALSWNTALLSMQPSNSAALVLQSELAMAAGNLPAARQALMRRVQADRGDTDARQQLARVTEWNGEPQEALTHWQWLAKSGHGLSGKKRMSALREVVRLAKLTLQPDIGALALRELTLLTPASDQDIEELVSLYVLNGEPETASVALRDIIAIEGGSAFVLRMLADHEYHHQEYGASLDAWNLYAKQFGNTIDASLARMELLWRLDRKDEAMHAAKHLKNKTLAAQASDYQLRVMSEIGWQYRLPWLVMMVQPRIIALEVEDKRTLYGRRSLAVLQDSGNDEKAMRESIRLWANTGEDDFALLAMQLAVKVDAKPVLAQFSPDQQSVQPLHSTPAYWTQLASIRLREGNPAAARQAYERALKLAPEHVESIAGLLWVAIGEQDDSLLQELLDRYAALAERTPELWQAMAVGYLQLGAASTSLVWFERLLGQIESDYGMLLTYADALEYAGKASAARKVRQYTLQQLRPLLVNGSVNEQPLLLRQYASLSTRYDSVESNEALVDYLLDPERYGAPTQIDGVESDTTTLWREDIAISWLMSTQQHEHARLIMSQIHSQRLQAPAWQELALALRDKDNAALESIVQAGGALSIGNHILALRQLGKDHQAEALAFNALAPGAVLPGSGIHDRQVASAQYISLRDARPSFVSGGVRGRSVGGLSVTDSGVEIRHTFANSPLGLSISALNRQLDSNEYQLDGVDQQSDLSLSLYFGGSSQSARLTTGINSAEQGERSYASGRYAIRGRDGRGELSVELAYNEAANYSPELVIAGAQNRATIGAETDFGRRQFMRLQADATEISTRVEQNKIARGLGGSIEVGVRGSFGSNYWSTSLSASRLQHEREAVLPAELRLSRGSTMDSVLAGEVQRLAVGASLSRGGIDADFPQVSSPRYYINSSLGQNWPEQVLGFQLDAGAGIRVIGGDELSFSVSHDTQPVSRSPDDATSLGVRYRYHFQ